MMMKLVSIFLSGVVLLTACSSPSTTALPTVTQLVFPTPTLSIGTPLVPLPTGVFTPLAPRTQLPDSGSTNLCADPRAISLIDSLKTAVTTKNGEVLASLVSPASGMEVSYFHNGTAIKYDQNQAKFLFETTYEANWGPDPASGAEKTGSFQNVVVPALVKFFGHPYTTHCNEIKYGGASYDVSFPYDKGYYSIYFPGTEANGFMDWQTWVAGIEYVGGKPYLYALMQFFWEP